MKILIIEDEVEIAKSIMTFLKKEAMTIEHVITLKDAKDYIQMYEYDCLVVDIALPDGSGLEIVKEIKDSYPDTGVIIVSAKDTLEDRVRGLELGADDYLVKPFHLVELNARIRSILRRRLQKGVNEMRFNEITVLPDSHKVFVNGNELILTKKEYALLYYFMVNKERILSKETIVDHLWGDTIGISADSLDFVYTHLRNLRKKLLSVGCSDYIRTVYGVGYKFSDES
ncbi:MAG: response regulator transcription factor [Bacteroidales bacterium]